MRAIWSGAIGFGLVNIPVKLFSAVQNSELDLDMLDKKDSANIHFQRVNANTGKEVKWENIVRGYKIEDHYVVLTDEDFKKASPEKSKMIEIAEFVNEKDIDSIYYETPYYLQPEKSGFKAYGLLRDALKKSGKAGLGTYVLRNRESLVLIKPAGNILILNKIRFQDEIRPLDEINVPESKTKPEEIKMAVQLIEQLTTDFDISKYKDTYTEKLLKLIKAKAKGKKTVAPKLEVVHSRSRDLMEQLKESLQSSKRKAS
ncbi:Non-homologous end joining protein Ku [Dyadobacter sp. CECT 9275]|uniref:Non-homologous end joining protein Ku n=1 Tax=Dyadobacter helix TaxID=2822344 RepID=A0A916JHX7_9BACT|nr:Ku protein [Dyadobacter sp. CECT 9275]CAG5017036.1 Non-homologous end joining protein Ku [Dyadobacter sp. CECT 9275]